MTRKHHRSGRIGIAALLAACAAITGCNTARVDVTPTAKGFTPATDPDHVEIRMTTPRADFAELAVISTSGWSPGNESKMHNGLRAKAALVGADAVLITDSGVNDKGRMWSRGVAIDLLGQGTDRDG